MPHLAIATRAGIPPQFEHVRVARGPIERSRRVWPATLYRVSVTRPDGTCREYLRTGGSSCQHIVDAIDEAGIGGAVRVLPVLETEAA